MNPRTCYNSLLHECDCDMGIHKQPPTRQSATYNRRVCFHVCVCVSGMCVSNVACLCEWGFLVYDWVKNKSDLRSTCCRVRPLLYTRMWACTPFTLNTRLKQTLDDGVVTLNTPFSTMTETITSLLSM